MTFVSSNTIKSAYLGKHAHDLLFKSSEQVESVYLMRGIIIPVIVSSLLQYLSDHEGASLTEIGRALGVPHQLVAQRINKLKNLSLIERRADPGDGRRFGFFLNSHGEEQARRLKACMEDMALIYEDLYQEIECDLAQKLLEAVGSLETRSLKERFAEKFPMQQAG